MKRQPRRIPEVLSPEEQTQVLRELEHSDSLTALRNLALIRLLLNAGLRAREARELRIKSLEFSTGRLKVRGKGNKERIVWLAEGDLALVRAWLDRRPSSNPLIFTTLDGRMSREMN